MVVAVIDMAKSRTLVRRSLLTLIGVPIGIAFLIVWSVMVKTSPTVADDDRIRGWESVWREMPATLFLCSVPVVGLVLAVRAGRRGDIEGALRAIWWQGAALFIALLIVVPGSTENIMTTRPATVKWLLLPVQTAITVLAVLVSRRRVQSDR